MSFLTYETTRPWAKAIKEAVLTRRMPPWFADPKVGHFANERRLSDSEIQTIVAWVDGGGDEGNPQSKPTPVSWTNGWNIKPDVVYEMPTPYNIPAKGALDYVYVLLPAAFPRDTWIVDGEIRPGSRSNVHHASLIVRPPGSDWMKGAKPGVPYVAADDAAIDAAPSNPRFNWLFGYAPGASPQRYFSSEEHAGRLIPSGSDIFLEMHYMTNGQPTSDQTRVGFVIAAEPPAKELRNLVIQDKTIVVPPKAADYSATTGVVLNEPVTLVFVQPHLHMRGTKMSVRVRYPDGRSEQLLSVPHYSYLWQTIYVFAKPIKLPKGAQIEVSAYWDNSANNKFNPDPSRTVRWGQQSWDEMLVAVMGAIVDTKAVRAQRRLD
jgi:hypothetical protein